MASVRSIDSALGITLNNPGRIIRNLIQGADTVMSHILHFYHLSAADFVDVSALGSPWDDGNGGKAFGTLSDDALVPLTTKSILAVPSLSNGGITQQLVESYVAALNVRKTAHHMGAIFSGRQPIQNAIVPGGVTTVYTAADISSFASKLNAVRNFINAYYIPDVVFVATQSIWTKYWTVGTSPGTLLSYGEYPVTSGTAGNKPFSTVANADLLIKRGIVTYDGTNTPPYTSFDTTKIKEYVTSSFYEDSTNALHPSVGLTAPLTETTTPTLSSVIGTGFGGTGTKYSWLKAPRYNGLAAEVGPISRMIVTVRDTSTEISAPQTGGSNSLDTYIGTSLGSSYTATTLVTQTLTQANALTGAGLGVKNLFSPLGRHACRALECKYVADAMYTWLDDLTAASTFATNDGGTYTTVTGVASGYSYVKIPKSATGEGLAEAPRGALGHWITISNKKIAGYQCVVPSTWNAGPAGNGVLGPAESVLNNLPAGTNVNDAVLNISRMLHPYDFCIACAVHVVTPEGKEITKFEMGLDGSTKKL
jgi:hydrogenase large subunit